MNKLLLPSLIILNFLNMLDVILTRYGLALVNTQEANPLYAPTVTLAVSKLLIIGLASIFILITYHYAEKEHNTKIKIFLTTLTIFLTVFYLIVVLNNIIVIQRSLNEKFSSFM